MTRFLALAATVLALAGCAVVTVPVKVAAKTVEVAVDVID